MNDEDRNLDHYLALPYGISLRMDDDGAWVARIEELPGCTAHGETPSDAMENLAEVKSAWIEDSLAAGDPIPEPVRIEGLPSGKWLQRVPRSLHKKLTELAKREGVSLNQMTTSILAEAVGKRTEVAAVADDSSDADSLWSVGFSGPYRPHWDLVQARATPSTNILNVLGATVSVLPNKMTFAIGSYENDFKAIKHVGKKETCYKA
jgi:antitoxin HicB